MASSITKNTLTITIGAVMQKIIAFVYFTFLARAIGVSGIGKYSAALAFTTIFVVGIDLGLTNVFIREAARAKDRLTWYLSRVVGVKLLFAIVTYFLMMLVLFGAHYTVDIRHLVYISGITMIFDSMLLTLYGALRILGDLRYEAIGMIGSQMITAIIGVVVIFLGLPLPWLMGAFLIASMGNALFAFSVLSIRYGLRWRPRYDGALVRTLMGMAAPFALAAIFFRVYSYIDGILLLKFAGETAAGWYSVPNKIVNAFVFIPLALVAAVYPRLSEYITADHTRSKEIFEQSLRYILLLIAPVITGGIILADIFVPRIFGQEYIHSIIPLQLLLLSMLFSYCTYPIGACLNAGNRQGVHTTIVGVIMVINILLNILFIPRFGVSGAALAALIGNVSFVLIGYRCVSSVIPLRHAVIGSFVVKIFLAALVMGIIVGLLKPRMPFILSGACGVGAYAGMILLLRVYPKKDLTELFVRFFKLGNNF